MLFIKLQEGSHLHYHSNISMGGCEDYPLETAREILISLKSESLPVQIIGFYFFLFK